MVHLTRFFEAIFRWEAGIQFSHFSNCFNWTDYTVITFTKAKTGFSILSGKTDKGSRSELGSGSDSDVGSDPGLRG